VHIAEDGEGEFLGRLELGGDAPSHREIRGPTCDGVVSSLALFLSIALATEPPPEPTHAPPPEEPGPPESPRTERPSTPSKREPARGATSTTTRDASRTVPYWEWDAGFQGVLILTGNVASGGRVYGELVRGFGAVSPSLRVSAGWSDFSVHPARAGTAELRRRTVRAEPCLRMRAIGRVTLSPCVGFEAGPFDVATPDLPRSAKTSTRWLAATGTLRGSLTLSSWISLEASASLLAPLERPAFALVEPFRPIYRAPPVLFELGAGVTLNARFF
jgi:hypothetical protein